MTTSESLPAFFRLAADPVRWRLLTELAGSDYHGRELAERVGLPSESTGPHLEVLRDAGLVTARQSDFDAGDCYYHLDLVHCVEALTATAAALHLKLPSAPAMPGPRPERIRVLFACTGNSVRSAIAEALLRHRDRARQIEVTSAGSHPKRHIDPRAVAAVRHRYGLDIAGHCPRHLDVVAADHRFDYVITLCDNVRERRPTFAGAPGLVHWSISGSAAAGDVAAELDTRIRHLLPLLTSTNHSEVNP